MKFEVNLENMKEIYGEEIIEVILDNKELIKENAKTLEKYKFNDIENIFERYPNLFMNFPRQFEKKIIKLKEIYDLFFLLLDNKSFFSIIINVELNRIYNELVLRFENLRIKVLNHIIDFHMLRIAHVEADRSFYFIFKSSSHHQIGRASCRERV